MAYAIDHKILAHQAAFDHAKEPCLLTTQKEGRVLAVNMALLNALKLDESEILGKDSIELGFWESDGQRNSFLNCLEIEGSLYHYPIKLTSKGPARLYADRNTFYLDVERIYEGGEALLFIRVYSAGTGIYNSLVEDHTRILEFLYRTSTRFFLDDSSDLYPYISRELHSLVPNSYVAVSTWDEEEGSMQIRHLCEPEEVKIRDLSALVAEIHPVMRVINKDDYSRLVSGAFFHSTKAYSEEVELPERTDWLSILPLFRSLGIRSIWHIGLSWGGRLFGVVSIFLCNGDMLPEKTLIETFVRQASVALQRNERSEALASSLHEKETLLREIHHRVKNNLQIISSLLQLQTDIASDSSSVQMLNEAADRVQSMALVHTMLYGSDNLSSVDTGEYLRLLATQIIRSGNKRASGVELTFELCTLKLDAERIIPLGLIVNELLTNALKYGVGLPGSGTISLRLKQRDKLIRVEVYDSGGTLPADFDPGKSGTLGMQLVTSLTHQLSGDLRWSRDEGTTFIVEFPDKE